MLCARKGVTAVSFACKPLGRVADLPATCPVLAVPEEPALPEAEEGAELLPTEAVAAAEALVQHYEAVIAAGKAAAANAAAALDLEKQALAATVKVGTGMQQV